MDQTPYVQQFLLALAETIAIEVAVLFVVVRRLYRIGKNDLPSGQVAFTGFVCSFATLPYLWFVLPHLLGQDYLALLVAGEAAVFALEGVFYRLILRVSWGRAMVISTICNAASLAVGLAVRYASGLGA
jgi:hypothetical protein